MHYLWVTIYMKQTMYAVFNDCNGLYMHVYGLSHTWSIHSTLCEISSECMIFGEWLPHSCIEASIMPSTWLCILAWGSSVVRDDHLWQSYLVWVPLMLQIMTTDTSERTTVICPCETNILCSKLFSFHRATIFANTGIYVTWFWKTDQVVTFGISRHTDFKYWSHCCTLVLDCRRTL